MHSPDGTVDEEDVAPRRLSLIKTSDGRDDMFDSSKKSMCNSTPAAPYFVTRFSNYVVTKYSSDKLLQVFKCY